MKLSRIGLLAGLTLLGTPMPPTRALAEGPGADTVKAGFVYNFSKFVEWPASALGGGSFQLCVAGQALDGRLAQLQGRLSQGREIQVHAVGTTSDLTSCHMLFIGVSEERRLNAFLGQVAGYPVLTVSDVGEFAEYGGMIGLTVSSDRVGFTINLASTRAAGLKPSAQLLRLGKVLP